MTQSYEAVREGSALADEAVPESNADARACAREEEAGLPSPVALDALTRCARQVRAWLARFGGRPGSRDGGRPGFGEAREWHHRCAGYYGIPVVRWARLAWGYAHMAVVKSSCEVFEWLTESPPRCAVAVAVVLVLWLGR